MNRRFFRLVIGFVVLALLLWLGIPSLMENHLGSLILPLWTQEWLHGDWAGIAWSFISGVLVSVFGMIAAVKIFSHRLRTIKGELLLFVDELRLLERA